MSEGRFSIHLLDAKDRLMKVGARAPLATLYAGDDFAAAEKAAVEAAADYKNSGRIIRFYNFSLFTGGMKDTVLP